MGKTIPEDQGAPEGTKVERITISPPRLPVLEFRIQGTAPFVSNNFSQEARDQMRAEQEAGSTTKKGKKREPKNFEAGYEGSLHREAGDLWYGIPATAFRAAMIDACRMAGFKMTHAKMSVFVEPDGFEADGTPLVRITKGHPEHIDSFVRNDNGSADIRPRGMWAAGWEAVVRVRYDADQFTSEDVANLLLRAGLQVGVGAGRPFSKKSAGQGWGTFTVLDETDEKAERKSA